MPTPMSSEWVSSTANITGIATGILALLGFVFYRDHLPTARLKRLDELMKETQEILDEAVEEDILPDLAAREDIQRRLRCVRADAHEHRQRTYRAVSFVKQYREFLRGLSWSIEHTCRKAERIRIDLTDVIDRRQRVEDLFPQNGSYNAMRLRPMPSSTLAAPASVPSANIAQASPSVPSLEPTHYAMPNLNGTSLFPELRLLCRMKMVTS
ncbi:hypothetical protein PLICRDRAFT_454326 [Plicaturopsis crispa FD-325 SS-3]|uniref:Uncharacterized protein n=1 Tax=Plicaturopsis crispa FD-325 SS-3 TaxID=944288 RepID=A0A0C9T5D4_PLICR|nr:hypothetical protein PLICRDRAFT_454326 [Plicaturopsis crispa FD-325 SS-3]